MALSVRVNKRCLFRRQECKRIFGGSRMCFVASPKSDEVASNLHEISQKLRDVNIDTYIAADARDPQKDVLCEKICSKIIESKFCIVLLNNVSDPKDNVSKPNPNVYFEYGLMTALRKTIIPMQARGHDLPFNIHGLDTVKYSLPDLATQVETAITETLLQLEGSEGTSDQQLDEDTVLWALDAMGLVRGDPRIGWRRKEIHASGKLGFVPYNRPKDGLLFFVGMFEGETPQEKIIARAKYLTVRIKNYCDLSQAEISRLRQASGKQLAGKAASRVADLESLVEGLSKATILVAYPSIPDEAGLRKSYQESVNELGLRLDLKALNDEAIRSLLGPE